MKQTIYLTIAICSVAVFVSLSHASEPVANSTTTNLNAPVPHCEVPCGIYADQMRFEQMLEDTATIAKSIDNIVEFSQEMSNGPATAKAINQVSRWIQTKESHATNTQHIVAQYFLTQRIKPDKDNYTKQLEAAHSVMVNAMKCKQDADPATAKALTESIHNLYRAYEGKEPKLHEAHEKK